MVAVDGPAPEIDWTAADEWRLVLTLSGSPCGELRLPNPGAGAAPRLIRSAILDHGLGPRVRRDTILAVQRRLALADEAPAPPLRCSVAICTRQRPELLARALASVRRADPAPHEILVIDSAPGDRSAAREAAAAGARHLVVERVGLNRARRVALEQATGDVVAFLDDDCLVPEAWLRRLPALFADPSTAAVAGPVLAWRLDTPARRRREQLASLNQGFEDRRWDWRVVRPVHSGRVGAGANIAVRRSALATVGPALPPELDVGTPTRSGGDLYLIYRLLAGGWRVVYDASTFVFHDHQPDAAALRATVQSYGTGFSAFLTRTLVVDREPAALIVWPWLWQQLLTAGARRAAGTADATELRLAARYAAATLTGPARWARSRLAAGRTASVAAGAQTPGPRPAPDLRDLSLVVAPPPGATVAPAAFAGLRAEAPEAEVLLWNRGAPAPGRAVVVVWDPGCLPDSGALSAHVAAHSGDAEQLAFGGWAPGGPGSLAAQRLALEEADRARRAGGAAARTLGDVPAGNLSMPRATFVRLAAEGPAVDGRVTLDLAARALQRGIPLIAVDAPARRVEVPSPRELLRRDVARGRADGALLERHPGAVGALQCARAPTLAARAAAPVIGRAAGRSAAALVLRALAGARARLLWARFHALAAEASYLRGLRTAGALGLAARARAASGRVLALDGDEAHAPPGLAAGPVEVRLRGHRAARVVPAAGQWSGELAEQVVDVVARRRWRSRRREWWREMGSLDPAHAPPQRPLAVVLAPGAAAAPSLPGARVEALGGSAASSWTAVDRALLRAPEPVVVVVLPGGRVGPAALGALEATVDAGRIAVSLIGGARPGEAAGPLTLGDRNLWRARYPILGRPPRCVVIATDPYRALRRESDDGPTTAVLDLVDRALREGWVVGHQELAGVSPDPDPLRLRLRAEAGRWSARGRLLTRAAASRPPGRRVAFLLGAGFAALGERGSYSVRAFAARGVRAGALAAGMASERHRARRRPASARRRGAPPQSRATTST